MKYKFSPLNIIRAALILATAFFCHQDYGQSTDAQSTDPKYASLKEKITNATTVVEGTVIETKGFKDKATGAIYTSALISISKVFKGDVSDTVIELIFIGGKTETEFQMVTHAFTAAPGRDGIFFLKPNDTGIRLRGSMASHIPSDGPNCLIQYNHDPFNHRASCFDGWFDDLEKGLFQPIESYTQVPRKVYHPNSFGL